MAGNCAAGQVRSDGLRGGQVFGSVSLCQGGNYARSGARRTTEKNVRSLLLLAQKNKQSVEKGNSRTMYKTTVLYNMSILCLLTDYQSEEVSQVLQSGLPRDLTDDPTL